MRRQFYNNIPRYLAPAIRPAFGTMASLAPYVYQRYAPAVKRYFSARPPPSRMMASRPPVVRQYSRPYARPAAKATLSKRVKAVEKKLSHETSTVVYKKDTKDTLKPGMGEAVYGNQDVVTNTNIELALAQARFFDPATPGTLITASLASPTYSQNIDVAVRTQCIITNNYQVPCIVTYGVATPRRDTSVSTNTALSNGWADVGNPSGASTLISFNDSREFGRLWKCTLKTVKLMPGKTITLSKSHKRFSYDPSYTDTETETYQSKTRATTFCYRCQGVLGHDVSVTSEQGFLPAGIDVYTSTIFTIYYNSGGAAVKTIVLNEGASQSFTNGGVVSSKPVSDNVGYSIA